MQPDIASLSLALHDGHRLPLDTYSFAAGELFYDAAEAYNLPWSEALQKIRYCLQIQDGTPTRAGRITFKLYTPNDEKTALRETGSSSSTQADFCEAIRPKK